jgi:hypothetical protein
MELASWAATVCALVPVGGIFLRANLLRMPPPAHGRCGEFDGVPVFFRGVGEDSAPASVQWQWSWEAMFTSNTGGGFQSSDIQGKSKTYPEAGKELWHLFNLHGEASFKICFRNQRRLGSKWLCPRF